MFLVFMIIIVTYSTSFIWTLVKDIKGKYKTLDELRKDIYFSSGCLAVSLTLLLVVKFSVLI